jgi:hypothetical protein
MIRLALIVFVLLTGGTAWAQQPPPPGPFQGTPEEQRACRPDSMRFCRDAVPNDMAVLACLQANRARISKACRQVLEAHGQ